MLNKISKTQWITILLFGLCGQFAWTIENMYFNVFLYKTITTDSRAIATMVAASAIVSTLATLLMGVVTDKLGKRKGMIVTGYILWGLSTLSFGFLSLENVHRWFPQVNAVTFTVGLVILMDCVMSFFGSTANDAAFNAWINDITPSKQRARVETVLAVLPLISMLVIFGGFDALTQKGNWQLFFFIFGIGTVLVGLLGIFLFQDAPQLKKAQGRPLKNILYGFQLKVIKKNPILYGSLTLLALAGISTQIFMPYFIIYIQEYLKIQNYALPLGIILVLSSILSVFSGKPIDQFGKFTSLPGAILIEVLGLLGLFFVRDFVLVILFGILTVTGYMMVTACLNGVVRDFTPKDRSGHFQGVRMIFNVLVPMIIGPYIGSFVIRGSKSEYVELGQVKEVPTPNIFFAAAVVIILLLLGQFIFKNKWQEAKNYDR